uniref:hypothetical protein n=1 Tax=Acetatifactor sp. TaxID=1872090 RepID=UPI0040570DDA
MMRAVYASVKQAISGKGFCLGVLGVVFIIFASSAQDIITAFRAKELLSYGFHHTLLINALATDAMTLVLPIFAALPFTASFVDDVKSGFIKEYLPRISILKYLVGRCSACVISGGLVFVCGILIAYMIAALIFTPMEVAPVLVPAGTALKATQAWLADILELMRSAAWYFCSGAFWSVIGLLFATLTASKYMAYASPFVFYYVLIILYERYFDALYVLYPKEWIMPSERWEYGEVGVVVFVTELTVIAALCFGMTAGRRLSRI